MANAPKDQDELIKELEQKKQARRGRPTRSTQANRKANDLDDGPNVETIKNFKVFHPARYRKGKFIREDR